MQTRTRPRFDPTLLAYHPALLSCREGMTLETFEPPLVWFRYSLLRHRGSLPLAHALGGSKRYETACIETLGNRWGEALPHRKTITHSVDHVGYLGPPLFYTELCITGGPLYAIADIFVLAAEDQSNLARVVSRTGTSDDAFLVCFHVSGFVDLNGIDAVHADKRTDFGARVVVSSVGIENKQVEDRGRVRFDDRRGPSIGRVRALYVPGRGEQACGVPLAVAARKRVRDFCGCHVQECESSEREEDLFHWKWVSLVGFVV